MKLALLASLIVLVPMQVDLSKHDPSLAEVIDILADYNVLHVTPAFLHQTYGAAGGDYTQIYGMADHSAQIIYIIEGPDRASRRGTAIHEILHTHYRNIGFEAPEAQVLKEEERLYKKLFGKAHGPLIGIWNVPEQRVVPFLQETPNPDNWGLGPGLKCLDCDQHAANCKDPICVEIR